MMDDSQREGTSQPPAPDHTCIIHQASYKPEFKEKLSPPKDFDSWTMLLEAAKIRNHAPVLQAATTVSGTEIPSNVYYHRYCRSIFTMKRVIQTLKRRADEAKQNLQEEQSDSGDVRKRPLREGTSESRVYRKECVFCGKTKYLPRSHTRETLTQAVQLRADETLRKLAVERGDEKIIAVTSRDIVAAEAHYHVSCYKNFTSTKGYGPSSTNEKTDNEDTLYQKAEEEAYSELWHYVKDDLVCN